MKTLKLIGIILMLIVLAAVIIFDIWYFVSAGFMLDVRSGVVTDGLGRKLYKVPIILRWLFVQEKEWAGLFWFIVDALIGLVSIGIIAGGIKIISREK